ncbi:MAG: YrhB domain-containing protein [Moraxellaceae bacterium]|nr:YrhB domain-containing protein [Moraxellaceae bacterium]
MFPITQDQAIKLAKAHIDVLASATGDSFELLLDRSQVVEQGWIFFFNTSDFVRTGSASDSLAGNGPLLVFRDGRVRELPSYLAVEDSLKNI